MSRWSALTPWVARVLTPKEIPFTFSPPTLRILSPWVARVHRISCPGHLAPTAFCDQKTSRKPFKTLKTERDSTTESVSSPHTPYHPSPSTVVENIWTIPNALCVMRIGMAPVVAYLVINAQFGPAIGVFAVAGVTDLLDGWIARVVPGQSSVMGSFLDPMADKILVGTLFLSLSYVSLIPVPLTALIIGRDAILIAFGFYIRYQSLDPPRTLSRYFNVAYPTAQLAPTLISKINTGVQLGLIGMTLVSPLLTNDVQPYLEYLWYLTAGTTAFSAISYCFAKDTVKLLRKHGTKLSEKRN